MRVALRETQHGAGLRARLGGARDLGAAGPEGLWLALEEAVSEISQRQGSVAYADVGAEQFKSQSAALQAFRCGRAAQRRRGGGGAGDGKRGGAHLVVREGGQGDGWARPKTNIDAPL